MEQPQEVEDEEYERVWERVAAVDVAKASGVVCTRVPHEDRPGRLMHVWAVKATKAAVTELGDHLRCQGIQVVTLESTSDYWQIWWVVLEAAGLKVQLVNARDVRNVPGRAKTDKKDAVWLAKLTERGMLRPSFVPGPQIRRAREFSRLRIDLVHDRSRHWARLEKLLERALVKISSVASTLDTASCRAMIEALIAGRRDYLAIASFSAQGKMRSKIRELAEALDGDFQPHHAVAARILLDQIDALTAQISQLDDLLGEAISQIPAAWGVDADGVTGPAAGHGPDAVILPAVARLDEIAGCGITAARAVIAEIGLDMTVFGTAARLVSWAKRSPQTRQSGQKNTSGRTGKGNPWLNGILGEIAAAAARTDTFLGQRYRRIARRRGKRKALAAIARSILVIIFHLLADPAARYRDLGPDWYDKHIDAQRKTRNLVRQLEALGNIVTLAPRPGTPAAAA